MIPSGLQAAAAISLPSSGMTGGGPQLGRSAPDGLVAGSHRHVIGLGSCPAAAAATGRQIAPGGRMRHPVEMNLGLFTE
jgi:hypothetical protein